MKGKRLYKFVQTLHSRHWQRRDRKGQDSSVCSSQCLQISFQDIHDLQKNYIWVLEAYLTQDRVQVTTVTCTGDREVEYPFLHRLHCQEYISPWTIVFFLMTTILKTIQVRPKKVAVDSYSFENTLLYKLTNPLDMLRNVFVELGSKL